MIVNVIQEITAWFPSMVHGHETGSQLLRNLQINWTVLAQQVSDPDLLGNLQRSFNNFIESGQGWALLIGLIIGYMIRGLTTYG